MPAFLTPFSFIITSIAGWLNQHQQHTIDYLIEENRVLRALDAGNADGVRARTFARGQSPAVPAVVSKLERVVDRVLLLHISDDLDD